MNVTTRSLVLLALLCASNAQGAASASDLLFKARPYDPSTNGPAHPPELDPVRPKAPVMLATSDMLPAATGNTVSFDWQASPTPGVLGYKLWWGNQPHDYVVSMNVGNVLAASLTGLVGTNYVAATAYDRTGLESTYSGEVMAVGPAAPTNPPSITLTADQASYTAPMTMTVMNGVTAGFTDTDEAGSANWTVSIPTDGDYYIYGHTWATNSANDSFYAGFDGSSVAMFAIKPYGAWQWSKVGIIPAQPPMGFTLTAGPHVLTVSGREAFTFMDKVLITSRTNSPGYLTNYSDTLIIQFSPFGGQWQDWFSVGLTNTGLYRLVGRKVAQ